MKAMSIEETPKNLQDKYHAELLMLYEISMAMSSTLRLDEILYIILTSVTSGEGLGFNRAMVFLVNEKENILEGRMGIGPDSEADAKNIWEFIENTHKTLEELLKDYKEFGRKQDSHFNNNVKNIKLPINPSSGILAQTVLQKKQFEIITPTYKKQI
ncbi:MAG: hypothetical protein V1747_07815 [Candidatus Omnitrophota bacterium]